MIDPALHDATRHDACEPFRWPCVTPSDLSIDPEVWRPRIELARRQRAAGDGITLDELQAEFLDDDRSIEDCRRKPFRR